MKQRISPLVATPLALTL